MAMSPRRRARVARGIQYAVLAAAVVVAVLFADWPTIRDDFVNPSVAAQLVPGIFTTALKNTVIYTSCGFVFGLALGLLLALMRLSSVGPYRWIATVVIEFFRGVPALVVFIFFAFGISTAFPGYAVPFHPYGTVTLALGLVGGAYMAETIRAGIQAVPKGQMEAARSLGMSHGRAMVSVVVPQAFRIVLPPLTNELILLTKDSSLIYVVGLSLETYELTSFGREALNELNNITPLTAIGAAYLMITVPLSIVVRRMEARSARAR
jgi:polar amino acid transport system permease protein